MKKKLTRLSVVCFPVFTLYYNFFFIKNKNQQSLQMYLQTLRQAINSLTRYFPFATKANKRKKV